MLAKAALTRPYDALIVDASWVKTEFSLLLPDAPNVIYLPDGLDFQQFPPIDPSQAKVAIAQGLQISDGNRPMVGLVLGTEREENLHIASRIAARHPEWSVLLYDEAFPLRLPDFPENVYCFGARQFDDPFLVPVVLSGLDVLFFHASVGAPARILVGAMACGTPLVTASRAPLLELDEAFPRIPILHEPVWRPDIPWAEGERALVELLANPQKRTELGARAKQRAAGWTWEAQVEEWIRLIKQLIPTRELERAPYRERRPLLFCRWYDKGRDTVGSQAVSWDNLSRQSVAEGLTQDLMREHTPTEIALVLRNRGGTSEQPAPSQPRTHKELILSDAVFAVETHLQEAPSMWSKAKSQEVAHDAPLIPPQRISPLETELERQFAEKAKRYPHATGYLRKSVEKSLKTSPFAASSRLQNDFHRSDGFWQHFNDWVADILQISGWSLSELCNPPPSELTEEHPNFDAVKEKWYETPYYPVSEHLNYIDFEPALERARFILTHLEELKWDGATFLDLGFGPGVLTALVLQTKPHWRGHGVDISSVCRDYAQKLLTRKGVADRAHLIVGDVRQLPYPNASFDVMIGMEVFEHIPNPKDGLSEAVRVLKPGGYAITGLPIRLPLKMHLHVFEDTQEVLDLYREVGLKVLSFQEHEYHLSQRTFIDTFAFSTLTQT
jgi:ubiquinone/menaquinone biosynthesis C-methylase UbiE